MSNHDTQPPSSEEIDDAIEAWHGSDSTILSLSNWLGWSDDEYSAWVADPDNIPNRPLATR